MQNASHFDVMTVVLTELNCNFKDIFYMVFTLA